MQTNPSKSLLRDVTRAMMRQPSLRCMDRELTVAIFGSTGFLGRYVCSELGQLGCTMLLPYRCDEMDIRHLKVCADLGQIAFHPFNLRNEESIRKSVQGADIVVNLLGKHYPTKHILPWWYNYTLQEANVQSAETIARIAKEENVPRFIHISSILAKRNSPSEWARTKYQSEEIVRQYYPNANILRPSIIYGVEDRFLNWYGKFLSFYQRLPLIENGQARVQPVYVVDVANAIKNLIMEDAIQGETFELTGEEEYTQREIGEMIFDITKAEPDWFNIHPEIAKMLGWCGQWLPDPTITEDLMIRMNMNHLASGEYPNLRQLDVVPSSLEREAFKIMATYEVGGQFQDIADYHN